MDTVEKLKNFMQENGWTVRDLAHEIGIPYLTAYKAIHRVEQGEAERITGKFESQFRTRFGSKITDAIFGYEAEMVA